MSEMAPQRTLLIVDVQNDFCEGGALAVEGGAAVAERIVELLEDRAGEYRRIVLSRDWHEPAGSNGGHVAVPPASPDYVDTWPVHCVQGTAGADYHPAIQEALPRWEAAGIEVVHVLKGEGVPAYSALEGRVAEGGGSGSGAASDARAEVASLLLGPLDVVGLAFDYCVAASALDAASTDPIGPNRVLLGLTAAVHPDAEEQTIARLAAAGVTVADSGDAPSDAPAAAGFAAPTVDLLDEPEGELP